MKPLLTEKNKLDRVSWALSMICPQTLVFGSMHDYVVLHEKWFYMSETTRTFCLGKGVPEPENSGKSSRYTPKVMFLAAIARPRFDDDGPYVFDGMIGFWSVTEMVTAKRNSRNRRASTLEPKSFSVNRDVYRELITEKVIPAIRRKWPGPKSDIIVIQQDNAPFHVSIDGVDVAEEGQRFRWNIKMTNESANSPDFNVLDLGFFRVVQFLLYELAPRTIQELSNACNAAFDAYQLRNIDLNFISLQNCME